MLKKYQTTHKSKQTTKTSKDTPRVVRVPVRADLNPTPQQISSLTFDKVKDTQD